MKSLQVIGSPLVRTERTRLHHVRIVIRRAKREKIRYLGLDLGHLI